MTEIDVQPNARTNNNFLHSHTIDGDHHLAEKVFFEMIESDKLVDQDAISFIICIHELVENGQDKAERMSNNSTIVKNKIYASKCGYNSIIHGLCNSNNSERGKHIFDNMKAGPDVVTFNILIDV